LAHNQYIQQYRTTAIQTASPLQLVIMMYDGALRFILAAKHAMQRRDRYEQNQNLLRAQKIVGELICCLDMHKGGEIASNLLSIYTYVYDELVRSNIEDDIEGLECCTQVLSELRSGWVQMEAELKSAKHEERAAA
jgi:flagellar protein FliS